MGSPGSSTATHYTVFNGGCWVSKDCLLCPLAHCKDDASELWEGGSRAKWAAMVDHWRDTGHRGVPPVGDRETRSDEARRSAAERKQQTRLRAKALAEEKQNAP